MCAEQFVLPSEYRRTNYQCSAPLEWVEISTRYETLTNLSLYQSQDVTMIRNTCIRHIARTQGTAQSVCIGFVAYNAYTIGVGKVCKPFWSRVGVVREVFHHVCGWFDMAWAIIVRKRAGVVLGLPGKCSMFRCFF